MYKKLKFLWLILFFLAMGAQAKTAKEIFATVSKSVFTIHVYDKDQKYMALGSGVVVQKGEIITNCHVVKDAVYYTVGQGKNYIVATVLYADVKRDLCLLIAPDIKAPAVKMGSSTKLQVGDRVFSIGSPEGYELSLGDGLIAQLRPGTQYPIQTTAPISHGSSGGGLFNEEGQLIGITSAGSETGSNIGLAVPVEWINQLRQQKYLALRGSANNADDVTNQSAKSGAGSNHDWVLVDSDADESFYYDKNLIANSDGKVALYLASDFNKALKNGSISYKSDIYAEIFDCKANVGAIVWAEWYAGGYLKGEVVDSMKTDKPEYKAITDSWDKKIFDIVCGSEQAKAIAPSAKESKPNWEVIAENDDGSATTYINTANIAREKNMVTIMRVTDFKEKQYNKNHKVNYKSTLSAEIYDCKASTWSLFGVVMYAGNMQSGEAVGADDFSKDMGSSKITKGTASAIIWERVCGG